MDPLEPLEVRPPVVGHLPARVEWSEHDGGHHSAGWMSQ